LLDALSPLYRDKINHIVCLTDLAWLDGVAIFLFVIIVAVIAALVD